MPQLQVQFLDSMGGDIDVVNAARASFGRDSSYDEQGNLRPADAGLIRFLADGLSSRELGDMLAEIVACGSAPKALALFRRIRGISTHEQPFAQVELKFRVSAPLAIARQFWKSHVGAVGGDAGYAAWSEESGRYIAEARDCYEPAEWRARSLDVKQGSGQAVDDQESANWLAGHAMREAVDMHAALLENGIAPEQARFVLPQAMMTTWVWKGSLLFFARVCRLRQDGHAQAEAQEVANMIAEHCARVAPVSWAALRG